MSPADILQALKREMIREAFLRFGAVSPVGGRPTLSDSFSTWYPKGCRARLVLWVNLSSGTTRLVTRPLPAQIEGLLDRRGNLTTRKEAA